MFDFIKTKFRIILITLIFLILITFIDSLFVSRGINSDTGSIKFYDNKGKLFYSYMNGLEGYKTSISLSDVNDSVINSVLSAEDKRFYTHFGIDFRALGRALITNVKARRIVSGGSTITQQVVKRNLVLNDSLFGNKLVRKIRELYGAFWVEIFYSKDRILEVYLNNTYFGNMSYGIEEASHTYFNKKSRELSLTEAATLAGSIKSPNVLNPLADPELSVFRRNEVLELIFKSGYITEEQCNDAKNIPVIPINSNRPDKCIHFAEYTLSEVQEKTGIKSTQKLSGYKIFTTLNSEISEEALESARGQVNVLEKEHHISNASVIVLSSTDSAILTMIGSVDYFNEDIDGAVNVSISPRQPGSALKPITYAQAFYENHLTPDTIILDEKTTFTDRAGKSFVPYNYNGEFNGEVTARVALASSLNLPAVKVLEMIGVEDMVDVSQKLGIHSLNDPDRYDLSVTLGGGEVTLLELTNAYASFSRLGKYKDTYSVVSVQSPSGEIIYEHSPEKGSLVWGDRSEEISLTIYDILSDPVAKVLGFGRNNVLILPFSAASKTGTTTDWHDNWTVGYTQGSSQDFVVGVWVGNSDHTPMNDLDGVTGAGPIWRDIMLFSNEVLNIDTVSTISNDTRLSQSNEDLCEMANYENNSVFDSVFQITNPPNKTVYYSLYDSGKFERIKLEVSFIEGMYSVEYILNGDSLGKYYDEDNFVYLWNPVEGSYILEAISRNSLEEVMFTAENSFQVDQE